LQPGLGGRRHADPERGQNASSTRYFVIKNLRGGGILCTQSAERGNFMRHVLIVALVLSTASIVVRGDEATSKRWWAHVQALANDGMEGRTTGSLAHKRAADYVVAQFQRAGLEPAGTLGFMQSVQLKSRRIVESASSLALVRTNGKTEPLTLGEDANISMRVDPASSSRRRWCSSATASTSRSATSTILPASIEGRDRRAHRRDAEVAARPAAGAFRIHGGTVADVQGVRRDRHDQHRQSESDGHPVGAFDAGAAPPGHGARGPVARRGARPAAVGHHESGAADKLFNGSGHTFAEMLAHVDAGEPMPSFALPARLKATVRVERWTLSRRMSPASCAAPTRARRNEYIVVSATSITWHGRADQRRPDLQRRDGQRLGRCGHSRSGERHP
jgi:hypothetical protein